MWKVIKSRLSYMMFNASTEFSELILGSISLFTGLWLLMPYCHWIFKEWILKAYMPEVWGSVLLIAGIFKLTGVMLMKPKLRIFSALIATIAWLFLTASWYLVQDVNIHKCYILSAPITLLLAFYNILIYIKLRMIHINVC